MATKNLDTLYFAANLLLVHVAGSDNLKACISAICSDVRVALSGAALCRGGGSCASDVMAAAEVEVDGTAGTVKGVGDEGGLTVRRSDASSPIS